MEDSDRDILLESGAHIVESTNSLRHILDLLEVLPQKVYSVINESLKQLPSHKSNMPVMVLVDADVSLEVRQLIKSVFNIIDIDEIHELVNCREVRNYINKLDNVWDYDFAQLAFSLSCSTDSIVFTHNCHSWSTDLFRDIVSNRQFNYSYGRVDIHVLHVRPGVLQINGNEVSLYQEDLVFEIKHLSEGDNFRYVLSKQ